MQVLDDMPRTAAVRRRLATLMSTSSDDDNSDSNDEAPPHYWLLDLPEAAFMPTLLPAAVRRALQSYHFLMVYVGVRLAAASWLRHDSLLRQVTPRVAHLPPAALLLLGLALACTADELAYILTQLRLNTKAMLVARPPAPAAQQEGHSCCICQDSVRTVGLLSFCKRSASHASHWDCMASWFESGAHLSNCCPVCRGPLRLQPLPLHDRLSLVFTGSNSNHWRLFPNRLLLLAGSMGIMGLALSAIVGLMTLRRQWRPQASYAASATAPTSTAGRGGGMVAGTSSGGGGGGGASGITGTGNSNGLSTGGSVGGVGGSGSSNDGGQRSFSHLLLRLVGRRQQRRNAAPAS